jgi:hypothetical protein
MADTPGALQLRLLQTVTDVASDQNSTLVMPLPVELLRFFEQTTGSSSAAAGERTPAPPTPLPPPPVEAAAPAPEPKRTDGDDSGQQELTRDQGADPR